MSVHSISLQEAEGHLADLVKLADEGNDVVITRGDGPEIRLVIENNAKKRRIAGLHRGKIHVSETFDEPLGDDDTGA
jgi:antitoxin (DNA-binding transcriptional repressor) of toxin-antitoxin stability system